MMASLSSTVPFGSTQQRTCCRRSAGRVVLCRAQAQGAPWHKNLGVQLLAAGLAATVLTNAPAAEAGVVIQQPKTKKLFQSGPKPPAPPKAESSGGGGGGISLPTFSAPSLNFVPDGDLLDPRKIALPGAIAGIAAAGFTAYKFDGGFRSMIREGMVKDSTDFAGYEEEVQSYANGAVKGTKKISKAVNKNVKKAAGKAKGGLFSLKK